MIKAIHNPDVLSCLANLSNDEVFTPPSLANAMLDLLPQTLFESKETRFLDPCAKSGVFLREIAKRLMTGLKEQIPDEQERIDHIFTKQLFGIAITELTGLLSRRSVYCSKTANGRYSVCTKFEDEEGNIRFLRTKHTWKDGQCTFCGASQAKYDRDEALESHAYTFIHGEEVFKMQFDVIIGNPPYQLSTGGSKSQAIPIYQKFVEKAKKLSPRFVIMIIPDRWVAGGFGLNEFRAAMLNDKKIRKFTDFIIASDCFPGVDIPGGVCYFLWDRDHIGDCDVTICHNDTSTTARRPLIEEDCDVFIKYNEAVDIIRKVKIKKERNIVSLISSQRPFGLPTNFVGQNVPVNKLQILVYGRNQEKTYLDYDIVIPNQNLANKYKVFLPAAYGERTDTNLFVIGKPFLGKPNEICTETYVAIGPFENENEAKNFIEYAKTKFFRFLVLLHKPTQHLLKATYSFVPMQDFSKPLTDAELYAKYELSEEEINFIESMIRPME